MYWPIKKGTTEIIYKFYECHIPPVGFGCHSETGEIKKTDVIKRSTKASEQFWQATPLPPDYIKKSKIEEARQKDDPEHFDPSLEAFREQEWNRRLYGVWFYCNGTPVYITGEHYMYLNWWSLDDGLPKYREPDRKRYYVLQLCVQDDRCAGLLEASNRRSGKSYRGGLFLFDYTSRTKDANSGAQSKTDGDIKNLFKGKVVTPFRRLPGFWRPEIDTMAGVNPEKELRFTKPSRRGKKALEDVGEMGLNSFINFLSSDQYAYDGWKLHRYLGDEVGKTALVNVYDRWRVVKYCLRVGKNWIGKALMTTTVERLKGEVTQTEAFKKLWKESCPDDRDANGHTKSGLYKYFTPAYEMFEFDKFGQPLVEAGKEFYLNTRAGLADDPHALSSEITKNPFTEEELFFTDGESCLYDPVKLNIQKDRILGRSNLTERGTFSWKDGKFSEVVWTKEKSGRFEILTGLKLNATNQVFCRAGQYYPNNNFRITIGVDPFKFDTTSDNRRSDCAALAYMKYDVADKANIFNDTFICKYLHRAPTAKMQYEDILKMAWYFGCQILFESNVDNWKEHFKEWGCIGFLMKLPGEKDHGLYSDGQMRTKQQIADYTEAYINEHIEKVYFVDLIDDWLEFNIKKSTPYDLAMASGYTLIAAKQKSYKRQVDAGRDVSDYFPTYQAN